MRNANLIRRTFFVISCGLSFTSAGLCVLPFANGTPVCLFPFQFGEGIDVVPSHGSKWRVEADIGGLIVTHDVNPTTNPAGLTAQVSHFALIKRVSVISGGKTAVEAFFIPLWVPAVVFATFPAVSFLRVLTGRRRRQREFRPCKKCDYELTGNVSGVCPECGTPVPLGVTDKAPADDGQARRGE